MRRHRSRSTEPVFPRVHPKYSRVATGGVPKIPIPRQILALTSWDCYGAFVAVHNRDSALCNLFNLGHTPECPWHSFYGTNDSSIKGRNLGWMRTAWGIIRLVEEPGRILFLSCIWLSLGWLEPRTNDYSSVLANAPEWKISKVCTEDSELPCNFTVND